MAGFGDAYTVFLARAALARLQKESGLATDDVSMFLRDANGGVDVQNPLSRDADKNESSTFWETLADLFFAPESSVSTAAEDESGRCATVGIDPVVRSGVVDKFRSCKSVLLVRTRGMAQRERVVGLLQGFNGVMTCAPLEP